MSSIACPRCQSTFTCKADDIPNCSCVHVQLQSTTRDFLKKTKYGCLCNDCLMHLNAQVVKASEFPFDPNNLKPGLHYYMENGLMVFTEFYHIQRGYCCENNCKHCAYGNRS